MTHSRQGGGAAGSKEKEGDRKKSALLSQLTLVVAPESLILGFLGVEVFELSQVSDSVPQ